MKGIYFWIKVSIPIDSIHLGFEVRNHGSVLCAVGASSNTSA